MVEALLPDDPHEVDGYVLSGRLGAGGMGSVYLSHTRGGQPVALKLIRREFADDPEFRSRFAREVEAARRVQGAYTAAVLDSRTDGPQPWLASAYVPGPALSAAVRRHGPLPVRTVLTLAAGVAEALQSIHAAGVVHRDLKPSNVLLASDGPRVIDFGIARAADATALTGTDIRLGTPAYMSPEQAMGRPVGPPVDVFALGLVVFYAATRQHPFGEGDGQALLFRIVSGQYDLAPCPEALRPLVASCLVAEPEDRPRPEEAIATCRRLAEAEGVRLQRGDGWWLPPAVAEEVTAHLTAPLPTSPPEPRAPTQSDAARTPRRRWRTAAVGLAALVLGIGGTLAVVDLRGGAKDGAATSGGSGSGNAAPKNQPGWDLARQDVPITLQAPAGTGGSSCSFADVTGFDATALAVVTGTGYSYASMTDTFTYTDCTAADTSPYPDAVNGILLQDNRGVMDVVDNPDPTPAECRAAARRSSLPQPVGLDSLRKGDVLHKGNGLCIEAPDGSLVHLLINDVWPDPGKGGLPTFVTVATKWVRKGAH